MWLLNKSKNKVSSRKQIQMKEVKDGILVLPNNQYRLVLETSSINFELKSEEEQDVLIEGFQNFLNALPNALQILVRVRELDIDRYVEQIGRAKDQEKQKVYKDQIEHYTTFIKNLVAGNKILSRRFYIVIPYHRTQRSEDFATMKQHIQLSRDVVMRGLERLGMKARQLDSLEVLDLFYGFYNPSQIKTQELKGHTIQAVLNQTYA